MKYIISAFIFCVLLFTSYPSFTQTVYNYERSAEGNIILTPDIAIPKINPGYTVWVPGDAPDGMIVFTHPRRDTVQTDALIDYALQNNLAVLYATTDNRLEFLFDKEKMIELEEYIHEAVTNYNIPKENLLFCGMSLEGTRALKLAMFSQTRDSKYNLTPKAVAICDAPLDMVRFYNEGIKTISINFNPAASNEALWVTGYLKTNLDGTPADNFSAYIEYSPFCYVATDGGNASYFKGISLRAYTEPDVNWWIENRRKDYYSMNSIDLAALVNQLKILGNDNAELITTQDKGYHPDGTRHPHSWSIVDEKELIDWFIGLH